MSTRTHLASFLLAASLTAAPEAAAIPSVITDPDSVVGPETCQGCHVLEVKTWLASAHARLYTGDQPLHRRTRSREIAKNLGVRLIQHDSLCLDCHFTPERKGDRITALAGVSCESCHGAARAWVHVHNNFEGRAVDRATETPARRQRRTARNASLGMVFSATPYALLTRCFRCHTVPDQRLVDVGGHPSGGTVPLLERLEAIRHNFVTGERKANAPFSIEKKRRYFVLAAAAELEIVLRAVAAADSSEGGYIAAKARRATVLSRQLGRLQKRQPLAEIDALLGVVEGLRLEAGNGAELLPAAEQVATIGRGLARDTAGAEAATRLAGLDPLLAGTAADTDSATLAAVQPLGAVGADKDDNNDNGSGSGSRDDEGRAIAASTATGSPPAAARARSAPRRPAGSIQDQLRPPLSARRIVGQGRCASCHGKASGVWAGGPHDTAANPFFDRDPRVRRLARLYYGRAVDEHLTTARAVCMDCHGAVSTGAVETDSGPTCESCHGPAGDYLATHSTIPREQRFALGVVDLRDADRRARVCVGCHYITDPRLLASGHPSGRNFDLAARSRQIAHGTAPPPTAAVLAAAWGRAVDRRGPIPEVEVVTAELATGRDRVASASPDPTIARRQRRASSAPDVPTTRPAHRQAVGAPSATRGAQPPPPSVRSVELPPWPEIHRESTLDELLEALRARLETLHNATGEAP